MLNTTKKSAAISLFVAAISCSLGLPLKAETLRQAMSAAYNNSGLLDQNRALLRAADEDVAQAAAALRPCSRVAVVVMYIVVFRWVTSSCGRGFYLFTVP